MTLISRKPNVNVDLHMKQPYLKSFFQEYKKNVDAKLKEIEKLSSLEPTTAKVSNMKDHQTLGVRASASTMILFRNICLSIGCRCSYTQSSMIFHI